VGRSCFLKTNDGGANWDVQSPVLGLEGMSFYALSFLNANFGNDVAEIAVSSSKLMTEVILGLLCNQGQGQSFNSIAVLTQKIAIAIGTSATIVRTTDGGNTWKPIPFELQTNFVNVRKLRTDFITIVGNHGDLYKSEDSGSSWQKIDVSYKWQSCSQ